MDHARLFVLVFKYINISTDITLRPVTQSMDMFVINKGYNVGWYFFIKSVCFVVVIFDLVRDVDAIFLLPLASLHIVHLIKYSNYRANTNYLFKQIRLTVTFI